MLLSLSYLQKKRPQSASSRLGNGRPKGSGPEVTYQVKVQTGDKKNCGTTATVTIQLKGSKGKMPKRKLTNTSKNKQSKTNSGLPSVKFSRNSTKTFKIKSQDLGELKSLTIEHDGLEKKQGWLLESIEVTQLTSKKTWIFPCSQWLSLFESDCQLSRELKALDAKKYGRTVYEVVTVTGDRKGAGTDSNAYITLYGIRGTSKKMQLPTKPGTNPFERGTSDIFQLKCNNVGPLKRIR
eukprot:XP_792928.4 PREDICTED: lipoxygenase homology domain-containing protein 1 [Strongylocentrotus purpuratus]